MIKSALKTRILSLLVVFTFYQHSYCQYTSAIINDNDGYTNVRKDSTAKSEIIERFIDGEVFEYNADAWYEQKNWVYVGIDRSNNKDKCKYLSTYGTGGDMHKSRVLPMDQIPNNFHRKTTDSSVELIGQNIQAKINLRWLMKEEIKVLSNDECIWGTDMGNPRNVITNVQLTMNGRTLSLPPEEYEDLYRATLNKSYLKSHKNFVFLIMSNSGAAGFYEVIWVFKDGNYHRRYINIGP